MNSNTAIKNTNHGRAGMLIKIRDYEELLTMLSEVAGAPIPAKNPMDWDTLDMIAWCRSLSNNRNEQR